LAREGSGLINRSQDTELGRPGELLEGLDATDLHILDLLQENCKRPLAAIGEKVGLTAPSVMERIHKLEEAGVIRSYVALLDGRALGKDVTAFIGVSTSHAKATASILRAVAQQGDVLECHHVTGGHSLMLKVKTQSTETLEHLIDWLREIDGVTRTETMVVLSTHTERTRIALPATEGELRPRRQRRGRRPVEMTAPEEER
jgi:Lrp/AsnC family leucine-responsive transcriptional regulator